MGCACTGRPEDYLSCAGIAAVVAHTPELESYADRVGTDGSSRCYVLACLVAQQIIYWANNPGDCPQVQPPDLSTLQGIQIGQYALAAGAGIASTLGAGLAATALGAVAAGVGVLALPFMLGAHHAAAVANEHRVLCQAAGTWNAGRDQVLAALRAGKLQAADARQAMAQVGQLADQIAAQAQLTPGDFAHGMRYAIAACTLYVQEKVIAQTAATGGNLLPLAALAAAALWGVSHG